MPARLEIKRSIAPNNLWHWAVVFDSGHIWEVSAEPYGSAELCLASAVKSGIASLRAAERSEGRCPVDPAATSAQKPAMSHPEFDRCGDPTDETLSAIEEWQPDFSDGSKDPWCVFIQFCKEAWNMDYGTIRDEVDGDDALLCLVTGGWSANEMVQGAMRRNWMFHAMRWHSSRRGGVVRYLAKY